jgi:putative FmdB family regulatory protein
MPTYEYECGACGHAFERFQQMTSKPVRMCPKCRSRRVRRLLGSGGALIFKGAGFHATDYRSESYKEGAKKDKPAAAPVADACKGCKQDPQSCPKRPQAE